MLIFNFLLFTKNAWTYLFYCKYINVTYWTHKTKHFSIINRSSCTPVFLKIYLVEEKQNNPLRSHNAWYFQTVQPNFFFSKKFLSMLYIILIMSRLPYHVHKNNSFQSDWYIRNGSYIHSKWTLPTKLHWTSHQVMRNYGDMDSFVSSWDQWLCVIGGIERCPMSNRQTLLRTWRTRIIGLWCSEPRGL